MKRLSLFALIFIIAFIGTGFAQLHRMSGFDVDSIYVRNTSRFGGDVSFSDDLWLLAGSSLWIVNGADSSSLTNDGTNIVLKDEDGSATYLSLVGMGLSLDGGGSIVGKDLSSDSLVITETNIVLSGVTTHRHNARMLDNYIGWGDGADSVRIDNNGVNTQLRVTIKGTVSFAAWSDSVWFQDLVIADEFRGALTGLADSASYAYEAGDVDTTATKIGAALADRLPLHAIADSATTSLACTGNAATVTNGVYTTDIKKGLIVWTGNTVRMRVPAASFTTSSIVVWSVSDTTAVGAPAHSRIAGHCKADSIFWELAPMDSAAMTGDTLYYIGYK